MLAKIYQRPPKRFLPGLLVLTAFLLLPRVGVAQETFSPWYVVIGGFRSEDNAKRQCEYAYAQNLPAVYAYNAERSMYYVYVRATQTRDVAEDIATRLRSDSAFRDVWLFNGNLTGSPFPAVAVPQTVIAETQPPPVPVDETEEVPVPMMDAPEREESSSAVPETSAPSAPPAGKPFRFVMVNGETGQSVSGLVRLFDDERSAEFRGYRANEVVYVPSPSNKNSKWFLFCHVPGYRPLKTTVAYDEVTSGNGEALVSLELQRVKRGDYIEMEGVKFYNNAALLTPGSQAALDDLAAMMNENPDYRIRLHGHTNGNHDRDIVSLGQSTDFFNPDTRNEKRHVSAKELALLRAELVKAYLVEQGIDAARITTKGEGGTQMIYDGRGTLAGLNDRVEVEIRKH